MSPQRPYFARHVSDLEALFARCGNDDATLRALEEELSHRKSDRSNRLRIEVASRIAAIAAAKANGGTGSALPRPTLPSPPPAGASPPPSPKPPSASPTNANDPLSLRLLAAWTALEALSPQTFRDPRDLADGDRTRVADLDKAPLPWERGERSRPNHQLFYLVLLGSVPMGRAEEALARVFGTDDERQSRGRDRAAVAAVLLDRSGMPLEENAVAVSSFAWALPKALRGELGELGHWPATEGPLQTALASRLRRSDPQGKALPVDRGTIDTAFHWLVDHFGLPVDLVEPPSFAIRLYQYYRAKEPPEPPLLNSFFLDDLARAAATLRAGEGGAALRCYLGANQPPSAIDVLRDRPALAEALAPRRIPPAQWPAPGGHALVTLQQAAVNLAWSHPRPPEGLLAVNGPPGTGKTTLLRDLVAAAVLDRARAMATFDDPEEAFRPSGQKLKLGDGFLTLYRLAPELRGHEVLVASSNNRAVENVSSELPLRSAVGNQAGEPRYFRIASDALQARLNADDGQASAQPDGARGTWGLIAAVLGNAANRADFQRTFWWNEDFGFRTYLRAIRGDDVTIEIQDEAGAVIARRPPRIIEDERPPSRHEAKRNWDSVRARFTALLAEVESTLAQLETLRLSLRERDRAAGALSDAQQVLHEVAADFGRFEEDRTARATDVSACREIAASADRAVTAHGRRRPGILARLFRTSAWRHWKEQHHVLIRAALEATRTLSVAEAGLAVATRTAQAHLAELRAKEAGIASLRQALAALDAKIAPWRKRLGARIVDTSFFAQGHAGWNLASPWLSDDLHRRREALFLAALDLHKAFIDASAPKLYHNLGALMPAMMSGGFADPAKRALLGDLWSSLFLVIPLVSTTFASVGRMLADLPDGSIGWLLIDEAGQATPQAAVGALLRAKRAVVVGDPLQIEPVVTIPTRLTEGIARFFRMDASAWIAPMASAQVLADRAARFRTELGQGRAAKVVGLPLLVHRRCDEPMFGLANRIAYDGLMVHAVGQRPAARIRSVLGPSAWFDVDGEATTKWCLAEGEMVLSLLRRISDRGIKDPNVFVITPFRIVAQEMRRLISDRQGGADLFGDDMRAWASERVGTIHTFQGREAEAVVLLLGAPARHQHGARAWAGGTPNILNVAATRAQRALYVVGSRAAWLGAGYFGHLASAVPVRQIDDLG